MSRLVDVASIERELAVLWKQEGEAAGGGPPAVMRACLMNLVVCGTARPREDHIAQLAIQVTGMVPARVLVAIEDPDAAADEITATIAARCALGRTADQHTQICCEQIVLRATGVMARRLPGAVVPLLLADLPVVLWWPDEPRLTGDPGLRLVQHADWLVVDSSRFSHPPAQLEWLSMLDRPIADMSWLRLRGWRDLTAGLFDARGFDSYPEQIDRIEITCEGDGDCPAEGLLLGCWIASRLGWHPGSADGRLTWHLVRHGGDPGELRLVTRAAASQELEGSRPGRVMSLSLSAGDATFKLVRSGPDRLTGSVAMAAACPVPRTARVVERDEATLLTRSLQAGGRDRIYDDALALAARLLGPDFMESAS